MIWLEPLRRILVGSVSGIAASLVKYWTHDHTNVLNMISDKNWDHVTTFLMGYGLGLTVLMVLGAIAAWISNETDIRKLFFIGLSAPALFAAGIAPAAPPTVPAEQRIEQKKNIGWIDRWSPISSAYADAESEDLDTCVGDSSFSKGVKTFFGVAPPEYTKFRVIVWSTKDRKEALAKAKSVNAQDPSFAAFVARRRCDNEYFPVVIGTYLPLDDARILKARASKLNGIDEPYLSAGPR